MLFNFLQILRFSCNRLSHHKRIRKEAGLYFTTFDLPRFSFELPSVSRFNQQAITKTREFQGFPSPLSWCFFTDEETTALYLWHGMSSAMQRCTAPFPQPSSLTIRLTATKQKVQTRPLDEQIANVYRLKYLQNMVISKKDALNDNLGAFTTWIFLIIYENNFRTWM